jgi:hypothetical protein
MRSSHAELPVRPIEPGDFDEWWRMSLETERIVVFRKPLDTTSESRAASARDGRRG